MTSPCSNGQGHGNPRQGPGSSHPLAAARTSPPEAGPVGCARRTGQGCVKSLVSTMECVHGTYVDTCNECQCTTVRSVRVVCWCVWGCYKCGCVMVMVIIIVIIHYYKACLNVCGRIASLCFCGLINFLAVIWSCRELVGMFLLQKVWFYFFWKYRWGWFRFCCFANSTKCSSA